MKVLLDTSALIYMSDFRKFDEILTVSSVIREVKDIASKMKLESLSLKVVEPSKEMVAEIRKVAKGTNDLEKLSKTDIDVIAAAKENGCTIVSDDRNVQNVAEKMGMKFISVYNKGITDLVEWGSYCRNCKKYFEGKECPICGGLLERVRRKSSEIRH